MKRNVTLNDGDCPLLLAAAALTMPSGAWAYIDIGTGSYLLQILAGIFFGGLYVVKIYWKKIVSFFRHFRHPDIPSES